MIVIDASMAANIVLPDETAPSDQVQERIYASQLIAPAHWPFETGNAILMAERRTRVTQADRATLLERLNLLRVQIVAHADAEAVAEILDLATIHLLTVYDAAYLHLAITRGAPLASNDDDLITAARASNVSILTGRQ